MKVKCTICGKIVNRRQRFASGIGCYPVPHLNERKNTCHGLFVEARKVREEAGS